jgi:hypothetical protein
VGFLSVVGALAGALYGAGWLPERWLQDLENEPGEEAAVKDDAEAEAQAATEAEGKEEVEEADQDGGDAASLAECGVGRDAVAALARQLATLQCQEVPCIMRGLGQEGRSVTGA